MFRDSQQYLISSVVLFGFSQHVLQIGSSCSRVFGVRADRILEMLSVSRDVDLGNLRPMYSVRTRKVQILSDANDLRSNHSLTAISKHLLVRVDMNTLTSLDLSVLVSNTFSLAHQTPRRVAKLRLTLSTSTNIIPKPKASVAFHHSTV